jgi:DNA polymerase-3 subunit delta'
LTGASEQALPEGGVIGHEPGVIGHEKVLAALSRAIRLGRTSHAYLITGPAHVGKMSVATALAQHLNCLGDETPCGSCQQCMRIHRRVHSDVKVVPIDVTGVLHEDGKPRTVITIDQVRAVSNEAALRPFEGRNRVFIFEDAGRLQEAASNALLKTLEEPPDQVVIILLALGEESVLPTISSRCQVLSLKPVPRSVLAEAMVERLGLDDAQALQIARTSGGRPGVAMRMATDEGFAARRSETLDRIESAAKANLEGRFRYAASMAGAFGKERESVREEIGQWRDWWRDVLVAGQGLDDFISHVSRIDAIRETAQQVGVAGAARGLRASVQAAERLDMNVAPALAIEQMMLSLPSR